MTEAVPQVSLSPQSVEALINSLIAACSGDVSAVATDKDSLDEASRDWSFHEPCAPLAVVTPSTAEEVAAAVRTCALVGVPIIPRGAGTGVEGGAIPYGGGVVLSTARLRHMELQEEEMMAVVGAGIYKDELNKFLEPHRLLFGPDPSSNPTLGGMASTGGSGMSTLRYGTTKENVVSLLVVTPQGKIVRTRRAVRKSSSGYELTQLYMGSEGTLGVICELTVRVRRMPPIRSGGVLVFPNVQSAVTTVVSAVKADPPSLLRCELLNAEGVKCTNAIYKTELECLPTLFVEFRGEHSNSLRTDFDSVMALGERQGLLHDKVLYATAGEDLDKLWEARRGCYLATMKYRGKQGGDRVFVSDMCVPVSKLADCVSGAEADCKDAGFECVICAHIADGNFHCLVPYQPEEKKALQELEVRLISRALAAGGTVSGEHGVGIGKVLHSCREHGAEHVAIQQAVKKALDPQGIMNPGKVLPFQSTSSSPAKL